MARAAGGGADLPLHAGRSRCDGEGGMACHLSFPEVLARCGLALCDIQGAFCLKKKKNNGTVPEFRQSFGHARLMQMHQSECYGRLPIVFFKLASDLP